MWNRKLLMRISLGFSILFVHAFVFSQTLGERIENAEKVILQKIEAPLIFSGDGKEVHGSLLFPEFNPDVIRIGQRVNFSHSALTYTKTYEGKVDEEFLAYINEQVSTFLGEKFGKESIVEIDPGAEFDEKSTDADFYVLMEWVPRLFIDIIATDEYSGTVRMERVGLNLSVSLYEKEKEGKKGKKVANSSKIKGDKMLKAKYATKDEVYEDGAMEAVLTGFYDAFKKDVDEIVASLGSDLLKGWEKK
ncbi:hypothetical protein ACFLT1_00510 [Bacteroidota bacterium]